MIQEGVINKYYFTFDLPVHQLSTMQPPISNSLVVKVGKSGNKVNQYPNNSNQSNVRTQDNSEGLWNLLDEYQKLTNKEQDYFSNIYYSQSNQFGSSGHNY